MGCRKTENRRERRGDEPHPIWSVARAAKIWEGANYFCTAPPCLDRGGYRAVAWSGRCQRAAELRKADRPALLGMSYNLSRTHAAREDVQAPWVHHARAQGRPHR